MRALFSTQPGLGHLHPMVRLARQLTEEGHDVAFAASASFCPTVEAAGFSSFAAGDDWCESDAARSHPQFLRERPDGQLRFFVGLASQMVEDVVRIADDWRADVVVREPMEFGAWMAAERVHLPHVTLGIMLRLPGSVLNAFARTEFVDLLSAQHLPADLELEGPYRYLYLDLMPPSFLPEDWPQPATVKHIRPVVFDRSGHESLPGWASELGERPVVYATLGTVFNQAPAIFRCIIDTFAGADVDLIVTLGRDGDRRSFGPQPENVHVERYVPQSQLLPLCDAVICHAGYGTLMAAMSNGVPVVCLPIAADQCFGAHMSQELGVGISLATHLAGEELFPHMGPGDLTAEDLRDAVDGPLTEPRYRAAACAMRSEIEAMPTLGDAAGLVGSVIRKAS